MQQARKPAITLAALIPLAVACASPPARPANQARADRPEDRPAPEAPPRDTQVTLAIDPAIRDACGLNASEAYFAFDSAAVTQSDARVLEKLARCFIDGAMATRNMILVGHADPRGDSDYNLLLGGRRADTVERFLAGKGLDEERVSTTSRGEYDARGSEESSWAKDRKVEVLLDKGRP
jgi:peptidoglycan-associated lipoprotein